MLFVSIMIVVCGSQGEGRNFLLQVPLTDSVNLKGNTLQLTGNGGILMSQEGPHLGSNSASATEQH